MLQCGYRLLGAEDAAGIHVKAGGLIYIVTEIHRCDLFLIVIIGNVNVTFNIVHISHIVLV